MSEVRLVVREAKRDWSGTMHYSCADRAIAALSADPVTLDELEIAVTRFAKPILERRFFASHSVGLCEEPYDAGLVMIDLVARLVIVDSTASSPGAEGYVWYHDGRACTQARLRYHLADDWLFVRDSEQWQCLAEKRRRELAARPIRDVRTVFYGLPMLEFVARDVFTAFARNRVIESTALAPSSEKELRRPTSAFRSVLVESETEHSTGERTTRELGADQEWNSDLSYETIKQIHAAWMLNPREDLDDSSPREVVFERRSHLMRDLQDRCDQWSLLGECPPGLEESSHAFRYCGFGTHELVMYYNLVRELLWSCWDRLSELAKEGQLPQMLSYGDFLTTEVPRLEKVRDAWLDTPDPEFHSRTPRSIINREQARLPEGVSGHESVIDPDCPCCQMMAESPGPVFWHFDGSGMDDDFAFDIYHHTRDEWEEDQRRWEEHSRRFNAECAEQERLGVADSVSSSDSGIWTRSASVGGVADVPLGVRVFGIGCHLSELIVGLRSRINRETTPIAAQSYIDQLNRDFGNLREILQTSETVLAHALIDPVLDRFSETLTAVAEEHPDLACQCDSLTDELQHLLESPSPGPTDENFDSDIPF